MCHGETLQVPSTPSLSPSPMFSSLLIGYCPSLCHCFQHRRSGWFSGLVALRISIRICVAWHILSHATNYWRLWRIFISSLQVDVTSNFFESKTFFHQLAFDTVHHFNLLTLVCTPNLYPLHGRLLYHEFMHKRYYQLNYKARHKAGKKMELSLISPKFVKRCILFKTVLADKRNIN